MEKLTSEQELELHRDMIRVLLAQLEHIQRMFRYYQHEGKIEQKELLENAHVKDCFCAICRFKDNQKAISVIKARK